MSLSFSRPLFLLALALIPALVFIWRGRPTSLTPRRSRDALILRCLTLLCLILAISGAKILTENNSLTVVYLLDRSLSTGGDSEAWQRSFVAQSLSEKGKEDNYGVVLFGQDQTIELPPGNHSSTELKKLTGVVDRRASQLRSALRFASTTFPAASSRRLVVLTDAQSTEAGTEEEIRALSDSGLEVWMVPMPDRKVRDVLLQDFQAPAQVAAKEPFLLRAVVESRGVDSCRLLITENGVPKQDLELKLQEGNNLFLLPQRKEKSGAVRYEARIMADKDARLENNKGETLTLVGGEQRVLVLRNSEGEGSLVPLLRKAGLKAEAKRPHRLPKSVGAWRDVSCLIIEDVDSLKWDKRLQGVVNLLVREGGMGLFMSGSNQTFGVGAYQKTAIEELLPVNLDIRRRKDQPLSALIQLIDKSGSMGGEPIRMAREAAIAAGETLSAKDLIGVVGFDSAARWVVPLKEKGDGSALRDGVSRLRAGGGTDLFPAFKQGLDKLERTEAPLKHIIVLSDGAVGAANYDKLLNRANKGKITVSAVAFGAGADIKFLENLTKKGKGRLFRSEQTTQGSTLAQIFIRDTVLAMGAGIEEKPTPIAPTGQGLSSPILASLQLKGLPRLKAYNMASSKGGTARTLLQSKKQDPILAVGRAGLGKTAAWLSDLGGDWAQSWDQVPGVPTELSLLETLLLRTIRSTISSDQTPLHARGNRLQVKTFGQDGQLEVKLRSRKALSGPVKLISITNDGESRELFLNPEGPYSAIGRIRVTEAGSGLIVAQDSEGRLIGQTNFSLPLAPEFLRVGTNLSAMKRWSQIPNTVFDPRPEKLFTPAENPRPQRTPLELDLARGALLLLLLEIAVRRMPLPKKKAKAPEDAQAKSEQLVSKFSRLRATKLASKARTSQVKKPPKKVKVRQLSKKVEKAKSSKPKEKPEQVEASESQSTLAQLKKARKKKKK